MRADSVACTPGKKRNFSVKQSKKKKKCERENVSTFKKKPKDRRADKLSNSG